MCFFCGEDRGGIYISSWKPFNGAHARMMHQLQVHGRHSVTTIFIEKEHKQEFIKKIFAEIKKMYWVGQGDEATG